jgi:hypothetical protein
MGKHLSTDPAINRTGMGSTSVKTGMLATRKLFVVTMAKALQ